MKLNSTDPFIKNLSLIESYTIPECYTSGMHSVAKYGYSYNLKL